MINNQKCEICANYNICNARAKMKPFTEEARTDLGVTLTFDNCKNFVNEDETGEIEDNSAE